MNDKQIPPSVAAVDLDAVVETFADEWRNGRRPGAAQWLSEHPQLARNRSVVLDLALEEFHQRQIAGEAVDSQQFCRQFAEHASAIGHLLSMHRLVQENPALFSTVCPPKWPALGSEFLGCVLLEELGRGAFSRVYLAREAALGNRLVAVKITQLGSAEARLLGKLEHPNIVPIYAVKYDQTLGLAALIMPYQGHATLADLVDAVAAQASYPADDALLRDVAAARRPACLAAGGDRASKPRRPYVDGVLALSVQLADGLAFMHAQGVRHQDIKPSNVLLDAEGTPRYLDFNLAYDERDARSKRGGTLPYMAPERLVQFVAGNVETEGEHDPRADIYALGVILYETLSGQHPFGAHGLLSQEQALSETAAELMQRQRGGAPPLCRRLPQVDEGLSLLVQRCLAWKATDRPASAAEVAAELRRLAGPIPSGRRLLRRKKTAVACLAAGVLACVLAGVVWLGNRPTWVIREFQSGVAALNANRPAVAEGHFAQARQAAPDMIDAALGLGLSLQRQGKYEDATRVYLSPLQPDARCYLGAAYCSNRRMMWDEAVHYYELAKKSGCDTAILWNNLAYSHLGRSRCQPAADCSAHAIERAPQLQAAYYNRAIGALIEAGNTQRAISQLAIDDIEKAIAIEPPAAEFHLLAARILCFDGNPNPTQRQQALRHLERAIDLGADPTRFKQEQFLWPLGGDKRFEWLAACPAPEVRVALPERVLDPLADCRL